jgi:hypothetical protein
MKFVLLLVTLLVLAWAGAHRDSSGVRLGMAWAKAVNCTYDNECATVSGKPVCLKASGALTGTCSQCRPEPHNDKNCYCDAMEYCVGDPADPKRGSCRQFEQDLYDRPCQLNLHSSSLQLGRNDQLFCGRVNFNSTGLHAAYVEWEGACWKGRCRYCRIEPFPGLPFSFCPDGRNCFPDGTYGYAYAGVISWGYWRVNPLVPLSSTVLIFTFLTFCIGIVYVISWYCKNRKAMQRAMHRERVDNGGYIPVDSVIHDDDDDDLYD